MITTEFAVIYLTGTKDVVCTCTNKALADKCAKEFVEYEKDNCSTEVKFKAPYCTSYDMANGHRIWVEEVRRVSSLESFKKLL